MFTKNTKNISSYFFVYIVTKGYFCEKVIFVVARFLATDS